MKPLQWVALGYLLLTLRDSLHGYDLTADPIAWVLVLVGLSRLGIALATPLVRQVAWLAAVLSVPLWVPAVRSALGDGDGSLGWAASLPQLAFGGFLCLAMSHEARRVGERSAVLVLQVGVTGSALVAALPVLIYGGGMTGLKPTAAALGALLDLYLVLTAFGYSGRSWAQVPIPEQRPYDDEVPASETPEGPESPDPL